MIILKEKSLKDQIIRMGKKLYDLRLVVARSGNLSARLEDDTILITATGASLGSLAADDIVKADLNDLEAAKAKGVTSEFPLHSLVYKNFPNKVIIHCHPTLVNAYFAVSSDLKALTFETKLYVGNIPVIPQETPSITKPELVVEGLKASNLVVLKNHGVVSIADEFSDALYLIETVEEAVKTAAVARLFKPDLLDELDKGLKEDLAASLAYPMFSREHIEAIVALVNKDEFIARKGQEMGLTVKLAIKMDNDGLAYKFNFENGKIVKLDFDAEAPYVISAPASVWEQVFLGKLDSFVAVTQGKMKLTGNLGQLSRWYVPFSRLFELFRKVRIK